MPAFALRSRQRTIDAEVARRPATVLLGFWIRDWFMWVLSPLERPLVNARVSPDLFNYLGVAFGAAGGVAFATGAFPVAGWMVTFGGVCDILDGRIARALGLESTRGAFLDSTLDRFAETLTFLGVGWFLAGNPAYVTLTMLAISGSLLVSYTRARGEALGVECKGGLMQRAERLVALALAAWLDGVAVTLFDWRPGTLLAGTVTLIGLLSVGTAIYRTATITRELRRRDTAKV
jgi:phosphatidylglycerophosphate synthase